MVEGFIITVIVGRELSLQLYYRAIGEARTRLQGCQISPEAMLCL